MTKGGDLFPALLVLSSITETSALLRLAGRYTLSPHYHEPYSMNDKDRTALEGVTPRLCLKGITKQFPGCRANDGVDLSLLPGEIHALLGENGAGKSTLVKIIYGILHADERIE